MEIGMLWFDDSPRPLAEKLQRAVGYYTEKYGRQPTLCLIHPSTMDGAGGEVAGVELKSARSVMPDHFWLGIDEKPARKKASRRKAA